MADGIYEWKDKKTPDFGSMVAPKNDPYSATPQGQSATLTAPKPQTGGETPSFDSLFKAGPAASGPTPSFNDLFHGVGEQRQQNIQAATQNVGQGLQAQGPSQSGQLARNALIKAQTEASRQNAEAATLAGRDQTGQITADRRDYMTKTLLPQRMDFEAQLQAQEETQAQARQQAAFGNLMAMEGLGSQERATDSQNALAARGQDITVRGQDLQSEQAKAALASQEKLGLADLSLREKELSQAGQQFRDELSFKKFATEGGWSQQEADRVWKSIESDKDRALTQSESALGRELQKYLGDRGLDIDEKQLEETIRQFDGKIAFDTWATQAGLDDNEKSRVWDGHLQDLRFKQETGERLGAQDHQVLIEDNRTQAQVAAQQFERLANLEVLGKTQEWEQQKMAIADGYQQKRDAGQMSHEQAMQAAKLEMEQRLTQMGVDAQAARQAAEIEANRWETTRQLKQQETLANADLLYKYASLREQSGLEKQKLAQNAQEIANQAAQFAQSFGLEEKKVTEMLNSQKGKDLLGQQAVLMELAGDNPDMVEFASMKYVDTLVGLGMLSPEEAKTMKQSISAGAPAKSGGPALGGIGSSYTDALDSGLNAVDKLSDGDLLGAGMDALGAMHKAAIAPIVEPLKVAKKVVKFLNPFD